MIGASKLIRVWRNARVYPATADAQVLDNAAVVAEGDRLTFVGPESALSADLQAIETIDCGGRLITPALIACHTHIVFGGDRAMEFEMRVKGATYGEIARAGGGIFSSVSATNALSVEGLVQAALPRVDTLLAEGVSTLEIKSGYGLSIDGELNMLRAARALEQVRPVRIVTTYLGAHATPLEYKGRHGNYISDIVLPGIDRGHAEKLIDAVDGFCEGIAFTVDEMRRVFDRAKALGIPVKLHAEQLSKLAVPRWRHLTARCRQTISSIWIKKVPRPWQRRGQWPSSCRGPFTPSTKPGSHRSRRCAMPGVRIAISTNCNSGHVAADFIATDDEHVGNPVPTDGRGVHLRRHARSGAGFRHPRHNQHARSRKVG